jgi:hypothetical protein
MNMTGIKLISTAAVLLCLGASAYADEGAVLRIEGSDVYVDLGSKDGVGADTKLTLLHVVVAKDPVSGKTLRDRFPIGTLTVIKSGDQVSLARAPESIQHRIKPGDAVALATARRTFADPWVETMSERRAEVEQRKQTQFERENPQKAREAARKAAVEQAEAAIKHAEAARAVWQKTLGKAPAERITLWQAYLDKHPSSPYAAQIVQEIASLRGQIEAEERVAEQMVDPMSRRAELRVSRLATLEKNLELGGPLAGRAPGEVYEGSVVELSFTVLVASQVDRAWLYYRHRGDDSYRRVQLKQDGDAYLRGAIPADVVKPPGVEYFVEIADGSAASTPVPAIGHQEEPRSIAVQRAVEDEAADIKDRSRVTLFMDYVDFDGRLNDGFDQYLHAEVDFMYRFYKPIYAFRVGFGTLGGYGGPKDRIDENPDDCTDDIGNYFCRRVSYSYAYTEIEYRFTDSIAVMLRPQFGTGTSDSRPDASEGRCNTASSTDPTCEFFSSFGMRARVRIGNERDTNLTLGVGVTSNIGTVFEAAYAWSVIPMFPVKLAAQVTDQPVPEDYGVRLIADVGWRALDWVYPSLRLAYQARDVDHAGLSGGLAVNFDW